MSVTDRHVPPGRSGPHRRSRVVRLGVQLVGGLVVCGIGLTSIIQAHLGLDPWNVFHQGLSRHLGVPIGTVTVVTGLLILLLWIPLRQLPGIGTLANAIIIGATIDVILPHAPLGHGLPVRWAMLVGGIVLMAIGAGMYLGTGLGAGPRDGLMTGLAKRGLSLRLARTLIELTALFAGWLLGGDIGIGTLMFALLVGPLVHVAVPVFSPGPSDVVVASIS